MIDRAALAIIILLLAWPAYGAGTRAPGPPPLSKVMVVIFENTDFDEAIKRPYFSALAGKGALLIDYHAVAHPSQPNYIALIAGDTLGVRSNKPVNLDARHLGDLLDDVGKSWAVYAEGYPGNCFLGETSGQYVRKHVPFLSFRSVQEDPALCARIKNASALDQDAAAGELPAFSLYVPDLVSGGHDSGVGHADTWMAEAFGPRIADPKFMKDLLLVVTFDEGSTRKDNRVLTLLIGDSVAPGAVSAKRYDHYSLLRTIELGMGLRGLGRRDEKAAPISGVWR